MSVNQRLSSLMSYIRSSSKNCLYSYTPLINQAMIKQIQYKIGNRQISAISLFYNHCQFFMYQPKRLGTPSKNIKNEQNQLSGIQVTRPEAKQPYRISYVTNGRYTAAQVNQISGNQDNLNYRAYDKKEETPSPSKKKPDYGNNNWINHFFVTYSGEPSTKIEEVLNWMDSKFTKAVIYAKDDASLTKILNCVERKFRSVVIRSTFTPRERQSKFIQFALDEQRVLITSCKPGLSFQSGVIDINDINLIINDCLIEDTRQYESRYQRNQERMDPGTKGMVVSLIPLNQKISRYPYYDQQALKTIETRLNISIRQLRSYTYLDDYITKAKKTWSKKQQTNIQKVIQTPSPNRQEKCDYERPDLKKKEQKIVRQLSYPSTDNTVNAHSGQSLKNDEYQILPQEQRNRIKQKKEHQFINPSETNLPMESLRRENLQNKKSGTSISQFIQAMSGFTSKMEQKLEPMRSNIDKQGQNIKSVLNQLVNLSLLAKQTKQNSQISANAAEVTKQIREILLAQRKDKKEEAKTDELMKINTQNTQNIIAQIQNSAHDLKHAILSQNKQNTEKSLQRQKQEYQLSVKLNQFINQNKKIQKSLEKLDERLAHPQQQQFKKAILLIPQLYSEIIKSNNYHAKQNQSAERTMLSSGRLDNEKQQMKAHIQVLIREKAVKNSEIQHITKKLEITQKEKEELQKKNTINSGSSSEMSLQFKNIIASQLNLSKEINHANLKQNISQFSMAVRQLKENSTFLTESLIYETIQKQKKTFLKEAIMQCLKKNPKRRRGQIKIKTKTLFEGDQETQWDHWLINLQRKSGGLLMLLHLQNDHIICSFCEDGVPDPKKKEVKEGNGFMASVTNKRIYDLKAKNIGKGLKYDIFMFIVGNNEISVKYNLTFTVIFNKQFCYYESGDDDLVKFIGQRNEEGNFKRVEFHQVLFSGN